VHDQLHALRRAHHVVAAHGIADDPIQAVALLLRAVHFPAARHQQTRHFPADAARCAQDQRFHVFLRSECRWMQCRPATVKENYRKPHTRYTISYDLAEPNWDLYRSFLSVLQEGSLSGAARALGLTQPTVGRHIDTLEQTLGLSLFTRSQSGFLATEAAHALRPYAETLASASSAALRAASGMKLDGDAQDNGLGAVTASEVVSVEVLPPILAQLRASHPASPSNWLHPTVSRTCCGATLTSRCACSGRSRTCWWRAASAISNLASMRTATMSSATACRAHGRNWRNMH
jgi:molybdenum-dependent DNA-binding transcriptional regulator ModE